MTDFCRWTESFFQNHHVLYLPNSYRTIKLAYNHSISHKTVHIICSVKVKTWIYQAQYSIYRIILIFGISIQLNQSRYCITGLMYHNMEIYRYIVAYLVCTYVVCLYVRVCVWCVCMYMCVWLWLCVSVSVSIDK